MVVFCFCGSGIVWAMGDRQMGCNLRNCKKVFCAAARVIDAVAEAFSYATAQRWLPPALSGYRHPLKKRALKVERSSELR